MDVEVNGFAIVLAAVAAMVIGSAWYANAFFGKEWRKLLKLNKDKEKELANKSIFKAVIASLISAYILSHIIAFAVSFYPERSEISVALSTAFFVWIGFYFSHMFMQDSFEQRPAKVTIINTSNMLVTLLAMGTVIALITY